MPIEPGIEKLKRMLAEMRKPKRGQELPEATVILQEKEEVLARFQSRFARHALGRLSADDVREFLRSENNKHWWGIARLGSKLTADMPRLRRALGVLLDESRPIRDRLDELRRPGGKAAVKGLDRAVLTPILHVAFPDKYGVLNSKSEAGMKRLGLWPVLPACASFGEEYDAVNSKIFDVARQVGTDLWTLDVLWWMAVESGEAVEGPSTYLLTWSPAKSDWNLAEALACKERDEPYTGPWRVRAHRRVRVGDRVFLLAQGKAEVHGIVASGIVKSRARKAYGGRRWVVDVELYPLLYPGQALPRERMEAGGLAEVHWDTAGSGILIPGVAAAELERFWASWLAGLGIDARPTPSHDGSRFRLEDIIEGPPDTSPTANERGREPGFGHVDYAAQDTRNRKLGREGEKFVYELEKQRLLDAGKSSLAKRVEWVSNDRGDGDGYDVLSFDERGREIYIEVKTTNHRKSTPFCITPNELRKGDRIGRQFVIYRLFSFSSSPRLYQLKGPLSDCLCLKPTAYSAMPAAPQASKAVRIRGSNRRNYAA